MNAARITPDNNRVSECATNAERGRQEGSGDNADSLLDPDAVADTYMHVLKQPRSAWAWEIEVRPWVERF